MTDIDEQSAELRGARGKQESGGGSINYRDSRVSKFINWLWGSLGLGAISAILYVGSQLGGLRDAVADTNLQVALSRQQTAAILEELKDHEIRLRSTEGDMRDVKTRLGMNLRSGPEIPHGR